MAESNALTIWDPLQYLSPTELTDLDKQLDSALTDTSCLVFWTGVPLDFVQRWAEQNGAKTLTNAMGPLFNDCGLSSARNGKSKKGWSRYMKGASGRFAQYACRGRQAIVLTNPPPQIYSLRKNSTFRYVEEPILKGEFGGSSAISIDRVHPTVDGAADFRYQVWPLDRSWEWVSFFKNTLQKKLDDALIKYTTPYRKDVTQDIDGQEVVQNEHDKVEKSLNVLYRELVDQPAKVHLRKEQQQTPKRRDAIQEKIEVQQKQAQKKKEAKQRKMEEQQKQAQEKKEAKQIKMEVQQKQAQEKKEAKQMKIEVQQKQAQEKKEAKQMKMEVQQKQAQKKEEAKQRKMEEQQKQAQEKKEAKQIKMEVQQKQAQKKKEAKERKTKEQQKQVREEKMVKHMKMNEEKGTKHKLVAGGRKAKKKRVKENRETKRKTVE